MVTQSILKILEGNITWDPFKKPDIEIFLKSVIKTQINHLYTSKEYRITSRASEETGGADEAVDHADPVETHAVLSPCNPLDPEMALLKKEREQAESSFMESVLKKVEGDSELEMMTLCILDGVWKPREISEKLGIGVAQVYNLKKRLRRIFIDLLNNKTAKEG